MEEFTDEKKRKNLFVGTITLAIFVLIAIIFWPFYKIDAGERGVLLNFGAISEKTINEGLHFKIPIAQKVVKIDVKTQKEETEAGAASKDLQSINATIALNYNVNPNMVKDIYRTVQKDYKVRLIAPAMQEAIKAVTAKFTAEELITRRSEVSSAAKETLKEKLESKGINVTEFSIINFNFSQSFDSAIEKKVTAEQEALAARNQLERVKFEAEQKIEQARGISESNKIEAAGRAEAIRVEAEALKDNPQLTELRAVERWDGKLPQFMTNNAPMPFINVN